MRSSVARPTSSGANCGNQPSARRPMRAITASTPGRPPPSHRGMGRWIGSGLRPAWLMWCQRPWKSTTSCVHSARITAICSSERLPRLWKFSPRASYSAAFQPIPTPKRRRPPLNTSTSAACFATSRRLPLAQNDDRGYQLDALGHSRQVPVEHKGLMKHIMLRIRPLPSLVMRGVHSQDMIKDNHVFVAYALSSLHEITHCLRISAYFGLWENHAKLHRFAPLVVPEPCGPEAFPTLWSLPP